LGRGETVSESDLVSAIDIGHLGGAVLDAFTKEPLSPESPLWSFENIIVSPHTASFTDQTETQTRLLFLRQLERYQAGVVLENSVDTLRGY